MDPVAQLLGLFILLHIVEGVLYVRRSAVTFMGRGRDFRPRRGLDSPWGTREGVFQLLSPLPPFAVGFVTEPEAVTIGPTAVVPMGFSRPGARDRLPEDAQPISEERLARAEADGKNVRDGQGKLLARTSSPVAARALAEDFRAFASRDAQARKTAFRERVKRRFDVEAVRARREALDRETSTLGLLGPLTWGLVFFTLYGVFHIPFVWNHWPWFASAAFALLVHLLIELWSAHRRLYQGLVGDRAMKLILILFSVPAAARARAFASRDALATFAPSAVAGALLDGEALRAFVAPVWRDLQHPLGEDPSSCASTLVEARGAALEALRALLEGQDIDPLDFDAAPERDEASLAYCPRCLAQYVEADGACEDCPGVSRHLFPAAAPAGPG